jgi:hypothetical protein
MPPQWGERMANKNECNCLSCGEIFTADVRNRGRQQYCGKAECRLASKAASQRRWLSQPQNRHYFRDAENAARVRRWQQAHPGYWRNTTRSRRRTLQETLPRKALITEENGVSDPPLLQEVLSAPGPLFIGLIATLAGSPLQEDIAGTSRRLVQLGHDILSRGTDRGDQTSAAP